MPRKDPEARKEYNKAKYARLKQERLEMNPEALARHEKKLKEEKARYERNKDKIKQDHAKWRAAHPGYFTAQNHKNGRYKPWEEYKAEMEEKRKKHNEYMTAWNKTEKGQRYRTQRTLRRAFDTYGLTIEQYEDMWLLQEGKCAICSVEKPVYGQYRLHIDHCHKTGNVRQLLCSKCNAALGQVNDSIEILQSCIEYLKKHGVVE